MQRRAADSAHCCAPSSLADTLLTPILDPTCLLFLPCPLQVGSQPWEGPASAANFSLCAGVTGIVRGQRKSFVCATGADGGAPVGQYIAIWRPSNAVKQLTLCEVDVELGPESAAPEPAAPAAQATAASHPAAAQAAAASHPAAAHAAAAAQQPGAAQAAGAAQSAAAIQAAVDAEAAAQLRQPQGGAPLGGRRRLRGVVQTALTQLKHLGGGSSEAANDVTK